MNLGDHRFISVNSVIDLSLEFLMGRALDNAMLNIDKKEAAKGIFRQLSRT